MPVNFMHEDFLACHIKTYSAAQIQTSSVGRHNTDVPQTLLHFCSSMGRQDI